MCRAYSIFYQEVIKYPLLLFQIQFSERVFGAHLKIIID